MSTLRINVRGKTPVPWGCNEWEWRKAVAEATHAAVQQPQAPQLPNTVRFSVEMVFLLDATHAYRADLDNLAKPVLDTLFRPHIPQVKDMSLTGALFAIDDSRVFRLNTEKRLVAIGAEEGIEVISKLALPDKMGACQRSDYDNPSPFARHSSTGSPIVQT
jgi:Holliday junction resolvase RusA-like endonuclease